MPHPKEPFLSRLGRRMVRRRGLVLLAWIAVVALALTAGHKVAGEFTVDYGTPGSDSLAARQLLEAKFPDEGGQTLLLTWRSEEARAGAADKVAKARADKVLRQLRAIPGVDVAAASEPRYSPDGKTALLTIPLTKRPVNIAQDDGAALMKIADGASRSTVTVRMGGMVIQQAQAGPLSSEAVGMSIALLILLLTFGTVVAAGLPIAIALFGIGTGSAFVGLVAAAIDTPSWAESVAAMIGIGVGIDYALLILTRHRANLRDGAGVEDSIAHALSTAGQSVLVAGGTVVISLLGLLFMRLPYLEGVAFSASLSVLVVLVAALTLLPALLGFAGSKIGALRIPGFGRDGATQPWVPEKGAATPADQSPRFARWTRNVQHNAWAATLASLVLVAVLTAPVLGVRLGVPGMGNDPAGSQSREAYDQITGAFGPGVVFPSRVVVPLTREGDRKRIDRLRIRIARDDRVAAVPPATISADRSTARFDVQSATEPESEASAALLETLRNDLIPKAALGGALVGGYTAETHDQSHVTQERLPILFLGVAGLSGILLLLAFRSIVVPIKAGLMNLFSIAAAYGVVALVAEGGPIGALVGIDEAVPIPPFIPVLMFAVLFGLSMDYEVFLVGRIREFWLEHGDPERAVVDGVAATARVITAAAAIMIAVFGAFALSDEVILKLIGIGMASAILFDATVIRLVLVPALMTLMGTNNWWLPAWLDRLLPETNFEGPTGSLATAHATAGRSTAAAAPAEVPAPVGTVESTRGATATSAEAKVRRLPLPRPSRSGTTERASSPRPQRRSPVAVPVPISERPHDWAERTEGGRYDAIPSLAELNDDAFFDTLPGHAPGRAEDDPLVSP